MAMFGLTGGIGSGKSTVAARLAEHGAIIIDADQIAREVVSPGTPTLAALVEQFGADILAADGSLDRPALAAKAFVSDETRGQLDAITHPAISAEFMRRLEGHLADAVIIHDVPLLAETDKAGHYQAVIVVLAPRELRLVRLEHRGIPRHDAEARMAHQASDDERRAIATWIIDNDGDIDALYAQVDALWPELVARAAPDA